MVEVQAAFTCAAVVPSLGCPATAGQLLAFQQVEAVLAAVITDPAAFGETLERRQQVVVPVDGVVQLRPVAPDQPTGRTPIEQPPSEHHLRSTVCRLAREQILMSSPVRREASH